MKKIITTLVLYLCMAMVGCTSDENKGNNTISNILQELHNPHSDKVLVVCHRGDWRNYPENSLPAIESVIKMGADIVELDIALTLDSVLVVCHDRTLNRTTTKKGLIASMPYDSIQTARLKTGHGIATSHQMPTLQEALELCKDRIVINIDKGYMYYDLVHELTEKLGMTDQVLIKGKSLPQEVDQKFAQYEHNLMYMPVVNILEPQGEALMDEYLKSQTVPMAYEICWNEMTPKVADCMAQVVRQGSKLWVNTLWPSLCGGLSDDLAFETSADEVYGKIISMGCSIIQTDRPNLLLGYLRSRGLHD